MKHMMLGSQFPMFDKRIFKENTPAEGGGGDGGGGGGGGSGGTPNQPDPNAMPAWAKTLNNTLQSIGQRQQAHDKIFEALADEGERGHGGEGQREEDHAQDTDNSDPIAVVNKTLAGFEKRMRQQQLSALDMQDIRDFREVVQTLNVDADTIKQAEKVFIYWRKTGMANQEGLPPSRVDALRYARGHMEEQKMRQLPGRRQRTQEEVDDENSQAFLGGGSGGGGVGGGNGGGGSSGNGIPKDFETMPRSERLKKYGEILDKTPW